WSFSSDQEHAIAAWLAKPGRDGEAGAGARAYNRAKKTACQSMASMLADLKKEKELQVEELEIDQLVNKVAKMVSVYKKQIDILEKQTGGGVLRDEHDTAEWIWNKQGKTHSQTKETIKTYLNRVCPWFYSFDDVLGTRSSVKPPVLLEGGVSKSNSQSSRQAAQATQPKPTTKKRARPPAPNANSGQTQRSKTTLSDAPSADIQAILDRETGEEEEEDDDEDGDEDGDDDDAGEHAAQVEVGDGDEEEAKKGSTEQDGNAASNKTAQTSTPLPGSSNPKRPNNSGTPMGDAVVEMVKADRERLEYQRQDETAARERSNAAEQARVDLERERLHKDAAMQERTFDSSERREEADSREREDRKDAREAKRQRSEEKRMMKMAKLEDKRRAREEKRQREEAVAQRNFEKQMAQERHDRDM
ncbi:hypothetical protein V8E36_001223, partial [Tilletia maclaganii]